MCGRTSTQIPGITCEVVVVTATMLLDGGGDSERDWLGTIRTKVGPFIKTSNEQSGGLRRGVKGTTVEIERTNRKMKRIRAGLNDPCGFLKEESQHYARIISAKKQTIIPGNGRSKCTRLDMPSLTPKKNEPNEFT
ncbi:hypothetical protein NPIL_32751 [Nephila pilipes]|uniref:Uncharacterized protein n=1 Tax=Nephila pilipes TaxID=299642 RepID=A0A8X6N9S0_NEPPI|nr:hypothetical protein NPIL_32751 [Nephila pilipes]